MAILSSTVCQEYGIVRFLDIALQIQIHVLLNLWTQNRPMSNNQDTRVFGLAGFSLPWERSSYTGTVYLRGMPWAVCGETVGGPNPGATWGTSHIRSKPRTQVRHIHADIRPTDTSYCKLFLRAYLQKNPSWFCFLFLSFLFFQDIYKV